MAYEKQYFVDGQVLKAEHLNHMEDGFEKISWQDLQDKPFEAEMQSDSCDFTVLPTVTFGFAEQVFYKISDKTPTYDQLLKSVFTVTAEGESTSATPSPENFIFGNEQICGFLADNDLLIGVAYAAGDITTDMGVACPPQKGMYLGCYGDMIPPAGTVISFCYEELKKIDPKFLPENAGSLPEVTDQDNGKLLGVVDGAWAAVAITDGNGVAY